MQETDDVKKLLQENAFEETSAKFNDAVMKRISASVIKQENPLLNAFILNLLKIVFLISAISIVAYFLLSNNKTHSILLFDLNNNVCKQLFSFLTVFWIMMLANTWWSNRKIKSGFTIG